MLFPRGSCGSGRRAFTLVELLVVITIIGILMGMLVPAVNMAREAGRQAQCKTNLKNLGVALETYQQQYNSLPFGVLANSVKRSGDTNWSVNTPRGTALHALLPFLEQASVYNLFQFPRNYNPIVPGTDYRVEKHRIPVFVCPSDDYRGQRPGNNIALHNYVASAGPVKAGVKDHSKGGKSCSEASKYNAGLDTLLSRLRASPLNRPRGSELRRPADPGPFTVHELSVKNPPVLNPVTQAMIRDGMSNTIMFGEVRPRCTQEVYWRGWYNTWNGCGIVSTLIPINYDSCDPSTSFTGNPCQSANNGSVALGFKSAHPGGAHFVMGDGSVHFFSETIDAWTFNLLGAIDDGLPVKMP